MARVPRPGDSLVVPLRSFALELLAFYDVNPRSGMMSYGAPNNRYVFRSVMYRVTGASLTVCMLEW